MKKLIATVSIVTALGAGAFLLNSVLPASAGGLTPQTVTASSAPGMQCRAASSIKGVLDKLVADGTISNDQESAIVDALKAARPDAGPKAGRHLRVLKGMVDVSATTIGVTPAELEDAVRGGQSVAQVATAHGVAPDAVVKAIVDAGNTKIDQLVTAGTLTDQQGTAMKARLPELADKFVNHAGQAGCGPKADQGNTPSTDSSSS